MTPLEVNGMMFRDVWWLALIKVVLIVVILLLWTICNVLFERRVLARMMNRIGPDFNGPFGFFQTIAEGVKLLFKEDFAPGHVDKVVYTLAPFLLAVPAFATWTMIPFGGEVTMFGEQTRLVGMDGPIAVLLILAIASVGIYGIVLAGWSSANSYGLLGSVRASAQTVSYEIAMGLSLVSVFLYTGSMSTAGIVEAQNTAHIPALEGIPVLENLSLWNAFALIPAFVIYFLSLLGEINRTPFDFAECEQELVSGHITEYTGFRYALYYLGEYINMATASALITTLFLGGYHAPWPLNAIESIDTGYWGILWFVLKTQFVIFCMVWIRASLPRLRYDKFMAIGWKWLIPIALLWNIGIAFVRTASANGWFQGTTMLLIIAGVVGLMALWIAISILSRKDEVEEPEPAFNAMAGGYPVPPLPHQRTAASAGVVAADPEPATSASSTPTDMKEA